MLVASYAEPRAPCRCGPAAGEPGGRSITLRSLGQSHARWFESLGIHTTHHWCIIRPILHGVHPVYPSIEVDIIFGNIGKAHWPPSLEQLIAVEAKCWAFKWEDLEPWGQV